LALELSSLLQVANIPPPYILVPHSYGGIISRELLALKGQDELVGMVLIDTQITRTFGMRGFFRSTSHKVFLDGLDEVEVLRWEERHKFTKEVWETFMADEWGDPGSDPDTVKRELVENQPSHSTLGEKRQLEKQALGKGPMSMSKGGKMDDYQAFLEAGMKRGNGTEEQREEMRKLLTKMRPQDEKFARDQLRLSGRARYVYSTKSGHEVQITEPALIAREVRWVFDELKRFV
jgi:pimeloyl-ACP methyl ester carboxylesterase